MRRDIKREFKKIAARYASLERLAETLRPYAGFEKINRATIHRWLDRPSRRTELAIDILKSNHLPAKLKIAEPRSLLVLPSMMIEWKPKGSKPYGQMTKRFGVEVEKVVVKTGGEALEHLEAGSVDIALAAPSLLSKYSPNCRRVCSLTRSPILGIANRRIDSIPDLKGLRCGYLAGSAVPQQLEDLDRKHRLNLKLEQGFNDANDCVDAFHNNNIDCFVAWQPFISQVKNSIPELIPVRDSVFDFIEIHVVVNANIAHPRTVRAYLECLQESVEYINKHNAKDAFHGEINAQLANVAPMSKPDIRSVLENSVFSLEDCDLATILLLWQRSDTFNGGE
jgi:hypothetical protein